ncbi:ABC transporter permease [Pyrodictium abyssi]|uniref:ABC transporter permease n=1 Tax=Pyrodictium abyssi TaxID=54256 RepID=A0ABM8J011_9CREN|nr:ABC transporter permease [Pyrodictium abyssi]
MAGLGRFIVSKLINTLITLAVALLLISSIFAVYSVKEKQAAVQEEFVFAAKQLEQKYKDPEELQAALKKLKEGLMVRYGITGSFYKDVINEIKKQLISIITFDFGTSRNRYFGTNDIGEQVKIALKNTMILFTTATIITSIVGILLGLYMARRPGGLLDRIVSILGMISWSFPTWWVGILLLIVFSFYLDIFPTQSKDVYAALQTIPPDLPTLTRIYLEIKTWLYYMALPLITLVSVSIGGWAYLVRNLVLEVMHQDFVLAARARGLPEKRVIYGHVLRTSSPPIVTYVALSLVGSFGGAIISETVFGWPGMGLLYWVALRNGETAVVTATTSVVTLVFILTVLLLDFIYMLLDPRIRTEKTG